ncbi:hypothetical protein DFH94DRAFT_127734 [Russula ochroleuca]|jgi:hypothetical protein|uniref:Uncharacterized protein n=1 Tax=Russula ochroleuca TaxID=152965 RepID=A0A9P5JZU9_9AGAM|nr:hypothetical protein DFH94DRAFT_127734 [Russula ochroleuca]
MLLYFIIARTTRSTVTCTYPPLVHRSSAKFYIDLHLFSVLSVFSSSIITRSTYHTFVTIFTYFVNSGFLSCRLFAFRVNRGGLTFGVFCVHSHELLTFVLFLSFLAFLALFLSSLNLARACVYELLADRSTNKNWQ